MTLPCPPAPVPAIDTLTLVRKILARTTAAGSTAAEAAVAVTKAADLISRHDLDPILVFADAPVTILSLDCPSSDAPALRRLSLAIAHVTATRVYAAQNSPTSTPSLAAEQDDRDPSHPPRRPRSCPSLVYVGLTDDLRRAGHHHRRLITAAELAWRQHRRPRGRSTSLDAITFRSTWWAVLTDRLLLELQPPPWSAARMARIDSWLSAVIVGWLPPPAPSPSLQPPLADTLAAHAGMTAARTYDITTIGTVT